MVGEHDGVRDGSIPSFGNGGSIPPSLKSGELSERLMVQTWKVCVDKTTRGSNPLFSARQYSSVIEQKIHTLLVGGLIPPTVMCR